MGKFIAMTPEARGIGLGLFLRAGASDAQLEAEIRRDPATRINGKWEPVAEIAWKNRSLSLLDLCRESVRLDKNLDRPVMWGPDEAIREAVSGGSVTNIFTTSVNAFVMQGWDDEVDTTVFCTEREVKNFKQIDVIDFKPGTELQMIGRGGTATHAHPSDTKESYKIVRFGKMFTCDEMDIIDDNVSALTDMPKAFGAAAKRLRPDLVYSLMLKNATLDTDSVALFDAATHANLLTGGGSALSSTALKSALTAMGKQQFDGHPLNIRGKYLIVPPDLKFTAMELINSSQILIAGTSGSVTERGNLNVLESENLSVLSDGRISDVGVYDPTTKIKYTGTTTNWWLASDRRTIEVATLQGTNKQPAIRGYVLDKGQWGLGWDVNYDIGAKAVDYRGFQKSAGA
jgi:hypothetical protein